MKTYLWYVSPTRRFTARGDHQQAAFDTLNIEQRADVAMSEFCLEIDPTVTPVNTPYLKLLELRDKQREAQS